MEINNSPLMRFAVYDCGTYGAGSYDHDTACSTAAVSQPGTAAAGGELAYTGMPFYATLTGVVLVVVVSVVLLVRARRRRV